MTIQTLLQRHPKPYLTHAELDILLEGTPDSRYSKVKRLLAQGKLLHIRRGLYCLTEQLNHSRKPHPYELAQYIYGPSYLSLESALSYHQLIPETVYTITSMTCKRAKTFTTPLGLFSYAHLPLENFYTGVVRITDNDSQFLIATPWKAICDFVFYYKKNWSSLGPLIKSLRIQVEDLPFLSAEEAQTLAAYYHHTRINRFLKGAQRELTYERRNHSTKAFKLSV